MISYILGAIAAGAPLWGAFQTAAVSALEIKIANMERDQSYAETAALRENSREMSRLVAVNQEVQSAYNEAMDALGQYRSDDARAERVRQQDRQAIRAAAQRAAAGTCARYAEAAERDLEFAETERSRFGQEAVAASAAAHAAKRTLDERRQALDARRQALKEK